MNRNYSDISYAESPFGTLSEFLSKTFGWMFAGLLVTFLVGIGAVTTGLIYPLITSGLFILTSIAELVLVFVLSAGCRRCSRPRPRASSSPTRCSTAESELHLPRV